MSKYVIELEKGCWLSEWQGDPSKTMVRKNAKKFKDIEQAEDALKKAQTLRPFKTFVDAKIKEV